MQIKRCIGLYLFFFIPFFVFSQQTISFPGEILSAVAGNDDQLIAITTPDSVYILKTKDLSFQNKWAHHQQTPVALGFHPIYKNVLLLQRQLFKKWDASYQMSDVDLLETYQESEKTYNELPQDSITMWDITKAEIVNTTSGCFYTQFGNTKDRFLGILNKVFPYEYQGKTRYGAAGADIESKDLGFDNKTSIKKTCRKLLLSPMQQNFAASWRDGYLNDTLYFSFSINDFKTHEVIFSFDKLSNLPTDFCFSPDGRLLAIASRWNNKENSIKIIDINERKIMQEIKTSEKIDNLRFSTNGHELDFATNHREWMTWDLNESRISQKIWRGLANMDVMNFAFDLNDRLLLVGTNASDFSTPNKKSYMMKSIFFNDVASMSKTLKEKTSRFADSTGYTMMMNDVPVHISDVILHFNNAKTIITRTEKNYLQVWQTEKKKKLLQMSFEKNIKAFPDNIGKNILVFEEKQQQSSFEYVLNILSLANSTRKSSSTLQKSDAAMNGSSSDCHCIPHPGHPAVWYCIDGSEKLWLLNGKDFSMKSVASFPGIEAKQLQTDGDGKIYVLGKIKKGTGNEVWQTENEGISPRRLFDTEKHTLQIVNDEMWMWNYWYSNDTAFEVWRRGIKQKMELPGKLEGIDISADKVSAMIQYDVKGDIYIQRFTNGKQQEPHNTQQIGSHFHMLKNDELLEINQEKGFISWFNNASIARNWSVQTPKIFSNTNFDVSENGNFILLDNRIIDLKEIEQWNLEKYNTAALLQDTGVLKWIEIHRKSSYGDDKGGFTLYRFAQNKKDTVKSGTWINLPKGDNMFYFNHDQLIASPDKKWAVSYTEVGMLNKDYPKAPPMLWDLQTMKGIVLPTDEYVSLTFTTNSKNLVVTTYHSNKDASSFAMSGTEYRYQLEPFKLIKTIKSEDITKHKPEKDKNWLRVNNYAAEWFKNADDLPINDSSLFDNPYSNYNPAATRTALGNELGEITIWEKNKTSPIAVIRAHSAPIKKVLLRGNRIYSLADNGEIAIIDISEAKLKLQIKTMVKDDELRIAMVTPEGYYRVDPDLMNNMQFIKNGEVFPLSSFEMQGNRPDKVYAAIGLADTNFISALKQSWETRMRRAGFDASKPVDDAKRPTVQWERNNLPPLTRDTSIQLDLFIKDESFNLKTLFIKVNGVPIGNKKGTSLTLNTKSIALQPVIQLTAGINVISVIAVNEQGNESLEETFEIQSEPLHKKISRLIYLGIGVSKYADSTMNLKYAAKDAMDINEKIRYYFDSSITLTLVNEKATREGILNIKNYLKQTTTEDIVLLSFAGHGLNEPGRGFFFAPHDMDFLNPATKGISMEMIEDLLDNIPARKRLLLLDACHSGEEIGNTDTTIKYADGIKVIDGRGMGIRRKPNGTNQNKNSYLLMKELFSDFSQGNGAFMISAAASNEVAFEGRGFSNGFFTMSFLEALRELRYDGSFGKQRPIRVRELRKLIYQKVSSMTNGVQNPTSRQENGWWNWKF
jgi:hypothetical protein